MTAGVIVLDKPGGITSFQAVRAVGRILGERKCGHAGTLDPMATGVLPVCVGQATKIAGYLSAEEKEYEVRFRVGIATDTGDITGKPVEERPGASVSEAEAAAAVSSWVGTFDQVPPMFSAVKVGGVRSYSLARKGKEVALPPRKVTVTGARLVDSGPEGFRAVLSCSKGFYVRSLPGVLRARLGVPTTVAGLRRLRVGALRVEDAVTLDALSERVSRGEGDRVLMPIAKALSRFPQWVVPAGAVPAVRNGRLAGAWLAGWASEERGSVALLVTEPGDPLAIVGRDAAGLWRILRGI